jgi:hypothetical protein
MTNDVSFEDSTIHINIIKKKGKKPSEACIQQDKHNINNQKKLRDRILGKECNLWLQ